MYTIFSFILMLIGVYYFDIEFYKFAIFVMLGGLFGIVGVLEENQKYIKKISETMDTISFLMLSKESINLEKFDENIQKIANK